MPMFDYSCGNCKHKQEHFCYPGGLSVKICPRCSSEAYRKVFSLFQTNVEYSDTHEHIAKVINPGVDEIYSQIGKEAVNEDTDTLENVFGTEKVKHTLAEADD